MLPVRVSRFVSDRPRVWKSPVFSLIAIAILALGLAGRASAQTFTWDGGTSGLGTSWNSATNWVGDTLPSSGSNSSGAVTGKMISPQNIAVGVTTVGLVGKEGEVLREIFWHSVAFAVILSLLAFAQAYALLWMVP